MNNQAAQTMPTVPQAFFDEFGVNADDRVMDYGRACYAAALAQTAGVPDGWKLVPVEPTEAMCEAAMSSLGWSRSQAAATAAPITPASPMMEGAMKVWSAMLASAPAASGGEDGWKRMTAEARAIQMRHLDDHQGDVYHAMQSLVVKHGYRSTEPMMQPIEPKPPSAAPASGIHPDALPDGTLSKSTAKRVEALAASGGEGGIRDAYEGAREDLLDWKGRALRAEATLRGLGYTGICADEAPQHPSAASVSERARALLAAEYRSHGWHEDAGRLCMGGDPTSFVEDDALRVIDRLIEQGDEDAHVITELGRLLASIAVILKGPEPAGTAWSYHDLPGMVNRLKAERDSAPSLEQALTQQWGHGTTGSMEQAEKAAFVPCDCGCGRSCCAMCGNDVGFLTPKPSADAVREDR